MSNQEKRRLERLKKELDSQQKKLDTEKRKYQRQLKELKAEQNKVSSQKRELHAKIKKFMVQQKTAKSSADKKKGKSSASNTGIEKKLRREIKELKSSAETTKKNLRETRKDLDAANSEIKILKRKLKHGGGVSSSFSLQERKLKQAHREIYNMKRRLKISIADLDKQSKYYESLLRRFKLDEEKWINRQKEIHKEKNIIIKYVFIDDIRKLKIYKDKNSRFRIKTHEGHEVVIKDIEITTTTEYDEIADEVLDKLMLEIKSEFGKRKKRKYKKDVSKLQNIASNESGKSGGKKRKKNEDNDGVMSPMSDVMSPISPGFDEIKDFDDIYDDIEHEDYIDSCFQELMKEISCRTHDLEKLNMNEDIEVLLEAIQERHDLIQQTLSDFQYEYVDEFPEINENWRNQMNVLIDEQKQKKEYNNNNNDDIFQSNERTNILLKVIDVLNNVQPKALLDEIIENANKEEDEEWKKVLHGLSAVKVNELSDVSIDKDQYIVCNELMNEMLLRQQDLESLRKFNENDMEPHEEIDNICDLISKRHLMETEKMSQINGTEDLLNSIRIDNEKWLAEMKELITFNTENVLNRANNQYTADELNGRIADLLKLGDIYNECKSTKVDLKSLKNKFSSFVSSIRDRHEFNHENNAKDSDTVENDKDWMDNIVGLASSMSGLKVNAMNDEETDKEEKDDDPDDSGWWLNQDENRNDTVDDITIDEQQQCGELYEGIMYLWRLLYYESDDEEKMDEINDVITSLYFPVPHIFIDNEANKHNMISVLYDSVILCKFINCVRNGYIDFRVVRKPNAFNPFPISDAYVSDNLQLVICSAQSLGIQLKSYDLREWLDPNNWVQYTIDLIAALSSKHLDRRLALHRNKELIRLVKNNEDPEEIRKLSGQEWLQRWCNYLNNKPVLGEIMGETYNNELFSGLKLNTDDLESFESDPQRASAVMIKKYVDITNVKPQDLCNGNKKLQDLFAADVYSTDSNLDCLSEEEIGEYKSLLKSTSKSKSDIDRFTRWINTALSPNITIVSLLKDLSSGYILLKLLDKSCPGCVEWRNVRKKIRHKFDKINNCNLIMKICDESLGFSLVGMAGSDIVDSNEKFIHSLLSQLMRCYATRQLSAALFKNAKSNKIVTDSDILQWVNLTITQLNEAQSKEISSFKDRVLSSCIIYIELLAAVKPNRIDLNLCNYDVKPTVNNKVIDKQKTERTENALYCITLIRRFGGELFVIPHHLCSMDYKAVLGVFAAIMTISMTKK